MSNKSWKLPGSWDRVGFKLSLRATLRFAAVVGSIAGSAWQTAIAENKLPLCAAGMMKLGDFKAHIERLRSSGRYPSEAIEELATKARNGGPEFFSSQIIVKEEQSGSGDYDLALFQGHSDPRAQYRPSMPWRCGHDDYPIAYFIGFKVGEIRGGAILVLRDEGVVNVISLKGIDPELSKNTKVEDFQSGVLLCDNIGGGCIAKIFYGRY
jgi:hypothetical protein